MATFANHASDARSLGSKLDQLLQVPDHNNEKIFFDFCPRSAEQKRRSAKRFLGSQRDRICRIEKELLAATVDILPPSTESKTITELAELCRLTQKFTREKLRMLKHRLEDSAYSMEYTNGNEMPEGKSSLAGEWSSTSPNRIYSRTKTKAAAATSPSSTFDRNSLAVINTETMSENPWHFVSFGGPLESVLEGEYETDGMTTPSSYLESPSLFSKKLPVSSSIDSIEQNTEDEVTYRSSSIKKKNSKRRLSSSFDLRSPATPPSLNKLSISASTNSFLRHMGEEEKDTYDKNGSSIELYSATGGDFIRRPSSRVSISRDLVRRSSSPENRYHNHHLFEFRDEDDMITLDTHSTIAKNSEKGTPMKISSTKSNNNRLSVEDRSDFLVRMEGILERVEETILEDSPSTEEFDRKGNPSKPSDELKFASVLTRQGEVRQYQQHCTNPSVDTKNIRDKTISSYQSNNIIFDEKNPWSRMCDEDDCDMEESDDSTNVVATQVAEKSTSEERGLRLALGDTHPFNLSHQRPSHIIVDKGLGSPANTNITMDATMMNETSDMSFVQKEKKQDWTIYSKTTSINNNNNDTDDIDNLSTETPVLDRFRLVASDINSNCVKVVPNKRSIHRGIQKRKASPKFEILPTVAHLSPSLAFHRRSRTPKKESSDSEFSSPLVTTSERQVRNTNTATPSNKAKKVYRKTPLPKGKFTVSLLEDNVSSQCENDHPNVPFSPEPFKSISVPPLRPSNEINLREETVTIDNEIDKALLKIELELASPSSRITSKQTSSLSFTKLITDEEFQSAPRIVRTHINLSQANQALFSIERYCSESKTDIASLEFTEREGVNILEESSFDRSKQILISLCHWGRLKMKKDPDCNDIVFAVNNEMRDSLKFL